jgi:probable rRNA maturation factor
MINFNYEDEFNLDNEEVIANWLSRVILSENKKEGEINYIFCDDDYLHKINVEYLDHDTLTDIISFDYSNAKDFNVSFEEELKRVLVHGLLHYCGYKDKTEADEALMRSKENDKIAMFHVEQ